MILGVGTDIVKISRISKVYGKYKEKFLQKILTNSEIERLESFSSTSRTIGYIAKRFSAKESFSKAIGTGIGKNISFHDIEIVNDAYNKPSFIINHRVKNYIFKKYNCQCIFHLSMSDEIDLASTFVIVEKEDK